MSELQKEYYIPFVANTENKLFLGTDEKSSRRFYHFTKYNLTDGPMVFLNSYKDENLKMGIKTQLPDVFLDLGIMVIPKKFMEFLRTFNIHGLQLFPSIYIDDDEQWHEKLWLVNFFKGIDCIDKEKSKINYNSWEEGDTLKVKKTVFLDSVLRDIPEDERLIFKMSNVRMAHLYCHQRVVDFIREQKYSGIVFVKASDYKKGMEYRSDWNGQE